MDAGEAARGGGDYEEGDGASAIFGDSRRGAVAGKNVVEAGGTLAHSSEPLRAHHNT
jgi:hypothetical protein